MQLNFQNAVTETYCRDKFDINFSNDGLKVTAKNTSDILNNKSELEPLESKALEIYNLTFERYSTKQIAFCFDGGKDGHVVFHLLKNFLKSSKNEQLITQLRENKILIVNIIQDALDVLPEPRKLVTELTQDYGEFLSYQEYQNLDIKSALYRLKDDYSQIEAIFMGVRRTDNAWYANMKVFEPTDKGWPEYMRINPIVEWSYQCVWAYLLKYGIRYCSLYDEGYTSLGRRSNSIKNEHLQIKVQLQDKQIACYLPAYCLPDAKFERFKR